MRTDNELHTADRQLYASVTHEDIPSTHFIITSEEEDYDPLGLGLGIE